MKYIVRGQALNKDSYLKYKADNISKVRKYKKTETFKVGDLVVPNNILEAALTYKVVRCNKMTCWLALEKADYEKLGDVLAINDIHLRWVELIEKLRKGSSIFKDVRYNILKVKNEKEM